MKTKIQIKTLAGTLLFEYEKDNNSIKETLIEAVTQEADLRWAYLQEADLQEADLRGADLQGADLQEADLRGADLRGADLRGADNKIIKQIKANNCSIPMEGAFIAYKKASGNLIKLLVPEKAKRTWCIASRKCRAEYVDVIEIINSAGKKEKSAIANHDGKTDYVVGKRTKANSFNDSIFEECTNGIHFFITKEEAENW